MAHYSIFGLPNLLDYGYRSDSIKFNCENKKNDLREITICDIF